VHREVRAIEIKILKRVRNTRKNL